MSGGTIVEGTKNLFVNPAPNSSTAFSAGSFNPGVTGVASFPTVTDAWIGTKTARIAISSSSQAAGLDMANFASGTHPVVVAGLTYSFSYSFRPTNLQLGSQALVEWLDASNAVVGSLRSAFFQALETDDFRRVRFHGIVAPIGATKARFYAIVQSATNNQIGTVDFNGFQFEAKSKVTDYCDGTIAGCVWDGTAHASTSTRAEVEVPHVARGRAGVIEMHPQLWTSTKENALLENVTEHVVDGFVDMDYLRDVPMTATFEMTDPDLIRPYVDYLAPFIELRYSDGTLERHQIGLYWCEPPRKTFTSRGGRAFLDGRDLTALLMDWTTSKTYVVAQGTKYSTAIKTFLNARGLTRINIHDNGRTVPRGGLSWPPGTHGKQIVNDLAGGCGMVAPFADRFGVVTSFPFISRSNRKPVKKYVGGDDGSAVEPFEIELVTKPINRVTVFREIGDGVQYTATKENKSPASSTSTVNIGVRDLFVQDGAIESSAAAAEKAQEILEEYGSLEISATFWTMPEPWHDIHELYELALTYTDGTPIPQATGFFWATSWKIGFSPASARMQHRLKKFIDLSAY